MVIRVLLHNHVHGYQRGLVSLCCVTVAVWSSHPRPSRRNGPWFVLPGPTGVMDSSRQDDERALSWGRVVMEVVEDLVVESER